MKKVDKDLGRFLKETTEIDPKKEYWFVRTDGGEYYDTFKKNNFIALGWNEITVEEIKKSLADPEPLKKKIAELSVLEERKTAKKYGRSENPYNIIDLKTASGKSKATMILHKLQNFYKLKVGDVIVIPSHGSSKLSFGHIEDNGIYIDNNKSLECEFRKRRKVKWVVHKNFNELDTIFYTLRSWHAMSLIKEDLEEHVDRVMNNVYFKDGYGHYVIRVKKKEDIKAEDLFELGSDIMKLLSLINTSNGYNEKIAETIVKLNVQSNGDVLLKSPLGKSIVALALCINLIACNEKTDHIIPDNQHTKKIVDTISQKITVLQIQVESEY